MKTIFTFFLLFIISTSTFGQITFEKGYLIDNNNQRIECFIKNSDWRVNPKEFDYKLTENDTPKKADLTTTKEFSVPGVMKFVRVDINIDRSSMDASNLSDSKEPVWSKEKLFLKVIVEGKATLYFYQENLFYRFFYSVDHSAIKQLVFKDYILRDRDNHYSTNSEFQRQIWNDVKCKNTTMAEVSGLLYDRVELQKYFKKYNNCEGSTLVDYDNNKDRINFNFKITPGLVYSKLSVSNLMDLRHAEYKDQLTYRIGLEAEYILPFNMNSWGLSLEPNYGYFKQQAKGTNLNAANISTFELPMGIRHYFILNDKAKFFLDAQATLIGLNFNSNFDVQYSYYSTNFQINRFASNFSVGGGFDYSGISAEIRYCSTTSVTIDYQNWDSKYQRISLVFGYNLLNKKKVKK